MALFPHPVKVANWIQTEVLRDTKVHGLAATFPVSPAQVAELLALVEKGDISGKQAKEIHGLMSGTDETPGPSSSSAGMRVVSDEGALRPVCEAHRQREREAGGGVSSREKGLARVFRRPGHESDEGLRKSEDRERHDPEHPRRTGGNLTAIPHPAPLSDTSYSAMELLPGNDAVVMLDQRDLPTRENYHRLETVEDVARGIRDMVVRGAPAIGISAAYGLVLAARARVDLEGGRSAAARGATDGGESGVGGRAHARTSRGRRRRRRTASTVSRKKRGASIAKMSPPVGRWDDSAQSASPTARSF